MIYGVGRKRGFQLGDEEKACSQYSDEEIVYVIDYTLNKITGKFAR